MLVLGDDLNLKVRECRHIHRHSRESGNPKAIGSKCVFASYRILDSRFRGNDGNRRLETDILKLTTPPKRSFHEEFRYGPEQVAFGLRQAEEDTLVAGSAARPVR